MVVHLSLQHKNPGTDGGPHYVGVNQQELLNPEHVATLLGYTVDEFRELYPKMFERASVAKEGHRRTIPSHPGAHVDEA